MPVLFFDATGSVMVEVKNQKKVFLYSLVCHDKTHGTIIPIADFISSAHDTITIGKYLLTIKSHLDLNNNVPVVVTDFSWALMNAVLLIFNSCNILKYLEWCYDYICCQGIYSSNIKTILIHCSCHTLKNVVRKSKKVNCEVNIRRAFIFCFSLLQNSLTIKQFEAYLINIYNMFYQRFETKSFIYSFTFLKSEIMNRQINNQTDTDVLEDTEYLEKKANLKNLSETLDISSETLNALKKDSPFTIYFDDILAAYDLIVTRDNESFTTIASNKFYCPELFEIAKTMLYLLPFWSGLMFACKTGLQGVTRLDNNIVENRFGDLKVNKLKKRMVMPSELAGLLYKSLQVKYFQYYFNFDKKETKIDKDAIHKIEEQWNSKKKKNFNKEKGYYYKRVDNFGMREEELAKNLFFDNTSNDLNKIFQIGN